jgi:pantoate--beta-alanine ligase
MGALHAGHEALIRRAASLASPSRSEVVVSVFVNPTQFAPGEDYQRYPRPFEADCRRAAAGGASIVFAPDVGTVYPIGLEKVSGTFFMPALPEVATRPGLEDAHRPAHFAGVCQVVARLFDLVQPRWAVFGEKDYQQLLVIEAMVEAERDRARRWGDLEIIRHPTVREPDGLAMSSRNAYLKPEERGRALGLIRAIDAAKRVPDTFLGEAAMRDVLEQHELTIDYAAVRDARTLMPITTPETPGRALIAARVGSVRLIDNMAWPEPAAASHHLSRSGAASG